MPDNSPAFPAIHTNELRLVIPVFNDWSACRMLLSMLRDELNRAGLRGHALLVDDGSSVEADADFIPDGGGGGLVDITILRLRRNVGHQRAIALGLAYLADHGNDLPTVIMDADGEDAPADVVRLYAALMRHGGGMPIFANRAKRCESLSFRVFYQLYKIIHIILTGRDVKFGNFSILPAKTIRQLGSTAELWNHYAAAVRHSRLPIGTIDIDRAQRLDGRSSMSFTSLVIHGMIAISVYSDVVGVRLLCASATVALLSFIGMGVVAALRLFTRVTMPPWAAMAFGVLSLALLIAISMSLIFVFMVLGGRSGNSFLPIRDYHYYLMDEPQTYLLK